MPPAAVTPVRLTIMRDVREDPFCWAVRKRGLVRSWRRGNEGSLRNRGQAACAIRTLTT
jgi:hypothetical protein